MYVFMYFIMQNSRSLKEAFDLKLLLAHFNIFFRYTVLSLCSSFKVLSRTITRGKWELAWQPK